jgi:polyhydroxybutyrate depolymerase
LSSGLLERVMIHRILKMLVLLLLSLWVGACSPGPTPEKQVEQPAATATRPTPAPTVAPTPTPVPSARPTATLTPTSAPSASPTPVVGAIHNRPGNYLDRLIWRYYPRWFKVHVPPGYEPGRPAPLVLNLHGLGSNLEQQEWLSGMTAKADEAGFIVVYPQAGASVWNIQAGEIGAIDVGFFRELIAYLEGELSIDPARIYATGFSNGGGMAHRLACDLSDRIAAIAPVSGAYAQEQTCQPERPVPVLAFHGSADRLAPFVNEKLGIDILQWAADWAARNGCDPRPVTGQEGSGVTVHTWQRCEAEAAVTLYVVEGMGHTWPDVEEIGVNDLIWQFFAAHPLP